MKKIKVLFTSIFVLSIVFISNKDASLILRMKYLIVGFSCYMLFFHPSKGSLLARDLNEEKKWYLKIILFDRLLV